jgi:hypothetical protein
MFQEQKDENKSLDKTALYSEERLVLSARRVEQNINSQQKILYGNFKRILCYSVTLKKSFEPGSCLWSAVLIYFLATFAFIAAEGLRNASTRCKPKQAKSNSTFLTSIGIPVVASPFST